MFVQLEVLYFAQPLKLKFKASRCSLFLITMGPESRIQLLFVFWIIKRSFLNLHLPFVAFETFLLVYRQNY
jgi:hypothetical protein